MEGNMQVFLGWIILGAVTYWPYHAWCAHQDGTAVPTTYILLGMAIMVWINVFFQYMVKNNNDR